MLEPGDSYALTRLIAESGSRRHVQHVWPGVGGDAELRRFLASTVHWAELEVRACPETGAPALTAGTFLEVFAEEGHPARRLTRHLASLQRHDRGVRLNLAAGEPLLSRALGILGELGLDDRSLWFSGHIDRLEETGFREIVLRRPRAIVQAPVDFLQPLISAAPRHAEAALDALAGWGISRFSISWSTPDRRRVCDRLMDWSFEVDVRDVPDLEAFRQAVLLEPSSISPAFEFPSPSADTRREQLARPSREHAISER